MTDPAPIPSPVSGGADAAAQARHGLDAAAAQARHAMVISQLRPNSVDDTRLIATMARVPRERFVPAARAGVAYVDRAIPLGGGRALNPPLSTARLINNAAPRATDRALLIGAASGYTAAVLAELVASVVALEEDAGLLAPDALLAANVTLVHGPLAAGWAAGAPYDLILIDGAIEQLPEAIVGQLADGGRLATGLVEQGVVRLANGRRAGAGFGLTAFTEAEAPLLPGFAKPAVFTF